MLYAVFALQSQYQNFQIMLSIHVGNFKKWDFCYTNQSEECGMSQTKESYRAKSTLSGKEDVGERNFRCAYMGCL